MFRDRIERAVFLAFVAVLPWMDIPWFLSPTAYARPASLWFVLIGLVLILFRQPPSPRVNVKILAKLAPWLAVAIALLGLSLCAYEGDWQFKERTRFASALRESGGVAVAVGALFYCSNGLTLFRNRSAQLFRALSIGAWISLAVALIQLLWFFFHIEPFETIGKAIETTLLFHGQIGKVHGLTPEGCDFGDIVVTIIFPLFFCEFCSRPGHWWQVRRSAPLLGLVACLIALLGTLSRIQLPALAFAAVGGAVLTTQNVRRLLFRLSAVASTVTVMLGLVALVPRLQMALFGGFSALGSMDQSIAAEQWSNVTRAATQVAGANALLDRPLGLGIGQYMFFSREAMPSWAFFAPEVQAMYGQYSGLGVEEYCREYNCARVYPDVKNLILRMAVDFGPATAIAALYAWWSLVRRLARKVRSGAGMTERFLVYAMLPMPLSAFGVSSYLWLHWLFVISYAVYTLDRPPAPRSPEPVHTRVEERKDYGAATC